MSGPPAVNLGNEGETVVIEVYDDNGDFQDIEAVKSPQSPHSIITTACLKRMKIKYNPLHPEVGAVPTAVGVARILFANKNNKHKTWTANFWVVESCTYQAQIVLGKTESAEATIPPLPGNFTVQSLPLNKEQKAALDKRRAERAKKRAQEKKDQQEIDEQRLEQARSAPNKQIS